MPDMLGSALALLPTLKNQARFKPEEVMLAMHEDIYSRFLIAPRRGDVKGMETHIASGGLGGFAGFVDAELRMHDFQLGRRNAQKFLRDHLVIHRDNPVVGGWVSRLAAAGRLEAYQPRRRGAAGQETVERDFVQLVPLVGDARRAIEVRPWPKLKWSEIKSRLQDGMDERAEVLARAMVHRGIDFLGLKDKRLLSRLIDAIATRQIRSAARNKALEAIREDLRMRGLLR
jgi:hypothetical protein